MFRSYCSHGNVSHDERNCRGVSLKTNKKMLFTVYSSSSVTVILKRPQNVPDGTGRFTGFILGLLRRSVVRKESRKHARGTNKVIAAVEVCAAAPWRGGGGRPRAQRGSVSATGVALALDSCYRCVWKRIVIAGASLKNFKNWLRKLDQKSCVKDWRSLFTFFFRLCHAFSHIQGRHGIKD